MELFRTSGSTLGDRLARLTEIWARDHFHQIPHHNVDAKPFPKDAVAALHDPLAVASMFGGEGLSLNKCALSFAENGERFEIKYLGEIEDGVVPESTQAINQVSVAVDRVKFGKFFADRMVNFLGKLKAS